MVTIVLFAVAAAEAVFIWNKGLLKDFVSFKWTKSVKI